MSGSKVGSESKVEELHLLLRPPRTPASAAGNQAKASNQEGWALLTLIFFSALLAISLASVLPRAAMEARREREADLIHRGRQYQRAIQLYYRKFRRYPSKMEELESTNRIRFLRRRFTDPIAGSEEWRLIHISPQGLLTDSVLQQAAGAATAAVPGATPGVPGALPGTQNWSQQPGLSSQPTSGFGQTSRFGQPANPAARPGQVPRQGGFGQPAGRGQRATGAGPTPAGFRLPGQSVPVSPGTTTIPGLPAGVQPRQQPGQTAFQTPLVGQPSRPGQQSGFGQPTQPGRPQGTGRVVIPGLPAGVQIGVPPGAAYGALGGGTARGMSPGTGLGASVGMTTTGFVPLAGNPTGSGTVPGQPTALGGQQIGGGIAGVASTKEAPSMKIYNGREKYNEWEFVYDFRRDPTMLGSQVQGAPVQPGALVGQPQRPGRPGQPQPRGFGQPHQGSFGGPQPGAFGQPPRRPGQPQPGQFGRPQPGRRGQPQSGRPGQPQPGGIGARPPNPFPRR